METIASEAEPRPGAAAQDDDAPFGEERFPLSGKVIKPTDSIRTFAVALGDPYDVVVTAAPRYTGLADQVMVRRSWATVAEGLAKTGRQRYRSSFMRGEAGAVQREPVHEAIRQGWRKAVQAGMPMQVVADLLGVTRQAVYNIVEDKVAGRPGRNSMPEVEPAPIDPVAWPSASQTRNAQKSLHRRKGGWSRAEVEVLKNFDLSDLECADQLKRSLRAVNTKRRLLGLGEQTS